MCHQLRSIITVEPVLFLFMTGTFLQAPAYQQLILDKVCLEAYNDSICRNIQENNEEFRAVQSRGSYIMLIHIAIMSLMSILPALILGAWSDMGSRRVGMILPCVFSVASGALYIVIYYVQSMTVYWTFASSALVGISGGHISMFLSVFSYVADITESMNRTFRMGIAESMIFLGGTFGFLLSGILLEYSTFTVVFGVYCGCNLFGALYVLIWLQESKPSNGYSRLSEECIDGDESEERTMLAKKSVTTYMKDSFSTIVKKREGQNRQKILLILLCIFLINLCNVGGVIQAPSGYTVAVLRSISSKIAYPNEQGAMFSIMASVETICLLIAAAIFNGIYPATLSSFPGMCFVIMAAFQIITFVLIQWISEIPTELPKVIVNEE
ncbi:proton-coupled folate transporter-like isoform X3 [Ranitomeya imitator]|uniref:proton-coupled folate transporter-like isoform X3 n=1 Tax=Ranitomeya imitator TaxID=111125 RepID=UPI0037E93863